MYYERQVALDFFQVRGVSQCCLQVTLMVLSVDRKQSEVQGVVDLRKFLYQFLLFFLFLRLCFLLYTAQKSLDIQAVKC